MSCTSSMPSAAFMPVISSVVNARCAAPGDFADEIEVLLAETLGKFVDHRGEQPARAIVHVLDGVDAKTIDIGKRDPELKRPAQCEKRIRGAVVVDRTGALADVLQ